MEGDWDVELTMWGAAGGAGRWRGELVTVGTGFIARLVMTLSPVRAGPDKDEDVW